MKVAVTGGSGFIGTHVLRALAARQDIELIAVARRPLASDIAGRVRHVVLDIANASETDFDTLGRPDVLIHLAWGFLANFRSHEHFEVEAHRHYRFLKSLVRSGLRSILCAGTCLEYGMQCGALAEDLAPEPHLAYPLAKDMLRRQLSLLKSVEPFDLTWARLFYVFGDGQPGSALYSQLMSAIERGERTFRMSRGEQLRDYLPVAQMAGYLAELALRAPGSGIVNVGSGRPISVRALVEQWLGERSYEMHLQLGHYPYPDYEPLAFWADSGRLRQLVEPL
jgi:dTDP-6-deoxy-L-talose 4-dehydrogenase (NAD+)